MSGQTYSQPISLRTDITITKIIQAQKRCARIEFDKVQNKLFTLTTKCMLYGIDSVPGMGWKDSLYADIGDIQIDFPTGMAFKDSTLFIIGNNWVDTTGTVGIIRGGILQPNGTRAWYTVMQTDTYPQANTFFDHGMSCIVLNPTGDSLYINSGSRTDHGEVQSNYNTYPGARDVPITSCILRVPANAQNLLLHNDSAFLIPYTFCDGTRNEFDMKFLPNGDLIGAENSGDRDHTDELNFLQEGKHFGFPWKMGNDMNPQQFSNYDPNTDLLINHKRKSWQLGYFYNDTTFPPPPPNITFIDPIQNYGPDGDKYRDSLTGQMMDASDLGISIGSFTSHRSPVGLVFDNDSLLCNGLTGNGFMLSYMPGADSLGNTGAVGFGAPADTSGDMLALHLVKNNATNIYTMQATRVIYNFDNPSDACMVGNIIYVVEYATDTTADIWRIEMPVVANCGAALNEWTSTNNELEIFPIPFTNEINIKCQQCNSPSTLIIYSADGKILLSYTLTVNEAKIKPQLAAGIYFVEWVCQNKRVYKKIVRIEG